LKKSADALPASSAPSITNGSLPRRKSSKSLLIACGLSSGCRPARVDVIDQRLRGVDGIGVGQRLAEALVEQLDELDEQAHGNVVRRATRAIAADRSAAPLALASSAMMR